MTVRLRKTRKLRVSGGCVCRSLSSPSFLCAEREREREREREGRERERERERGERGGTERDEEVD